MTTRRSPSAAILLAYAARQEARFGGCAHQAGWRCRNCTPATPASERHDERELGS